ncbi:hypothetical protein [Methylobacterium goesingense]|uniref:Uncharacterized protein n=1 Tax=Methylobacterium goesingense TaxID=243690 RepID=A0ABV2L9E5_9HYPH|nr:hypothetical protein [Methylobacterium goesingense]GJD72529.1 hypothetical protein CFIICLFH_0744 [Methylobacterium goesingense]
MAFFNDLVKSIAAIEEMDEITVRGIGINVREKGLISKGGRGLSAAKMSAQDAANLLIGVNASASSKEAADCVEKYGMFKLKNANGLSVKGRDLLNEIWENDISFGEFLARLIVMSGPEQEKIEPLGEFIFNNVDFPKGGISKADMCLKIDRHISLEIVFIKGQSKAGLRFRDFQTRSTYAQLLFVGSGEDYQGDRFDTTIFTQRTLRAVGNTIAK